MDLFDALAQRYSYRGAFTDIVSHQRETACQGDGGNQEIVRPDGHAALRQAS